MLGVHQKELCEVFTVSGREVGAGQVAFWLENQKFFSLAYG